jgi:hypothetical protein
MQETQREEPTLPNALDNLWRNPRTSREIAPSELSTFAVWDWIVLSAWDTAASHGPVGGRLDINVTGQLCVLDAWGKPFFSAVVMPAADSTHTPLLLRLLPTQWVVVLTSSNSEAVPNPLEHDARGLFVALQLIRDHVDSALLKSRERRDADIAAFAASANLDSRHFRRLAAWYPQIEPHLVIGGSGEST